MEEIQWNILLIIIIFGFLAAFIDSVVGGGGLISIPALLFAGLSPSAAVATNKLGSTMGSLTSSISFIRAGNINYPLVLRLFPFIFIGSFLGALVVNYLSAGVLKPLILLLLTLVAGYTIWNKNWGEHSTYTSLSWMKAILFGVVIMTIGFYDGFLGAGTGSFILFAFLLIGFNFIESAGNARILNFASNIAALITFFFLDTIHYAYGIPMGIAMIFGAFAGAQFALKKGVSYVRLLFIVVTLALIGKNLWDYVMGS